jgi:hypothetical protein
MANKSGTVQERFVEVDVVALQLGFRAGVSRFKRSLMGNWGNDGKKHGIDGKESDGRY